MAKKANDNLSLWDTVQETPPNFKKPIPGQEYLTTVSPDYVRKRATEMFGKAGVGWGMRDEKFEEILLDPDGQVTINSLVKYSGTLWYLDPDNQEHTGLIPTCTSAPLLKHTKQGLKIDDDVYKSVRTDGLSKAFSELGFGSDVRLGGHDHGKYGARSYDSGSKSSGGSSGGGATEKQIGFARKLIEEKNPPAEWIMKYTNGKTAEKASKDEVSKLIEALKDHAGEFVAEKVTVVHDNDMARKVKGVEAIKVEWMKIVNKSAGKHVTVLEAMCEEAFGDGITEIPETPLILNTIPIDNLLAFHKELRAFKAS